MIKAVWSDLKTFRAVSFEPHMNVVLADTAEDSEETESTNGLGKTTLIRIIQFCFGSDFSKEKILSHPDLNNVTFGLDYKTRGMAFQVSRNTSSSKVVSVTQSLLDGLPVEVISSVDGLATISLDDWKLVLSEKFYPEARLDSNGATKHVPTFRELILFHARLGKAAYVDPQVAFQGHAGASKRLATSFMLGLNWTLQRRLQNNLTSRAQIRDAIKAVRSAEEFTAQRTIGDLEAERVGLEQQLNAKRTEAAAFNVREDYRQLEGSLNRVDRSIHDLINDNHADARLLEYYQESAREIPEADSKRPMTLLQAAGAIFRDEALQRVEDVAKFHEEVYRNRKNFLATEIKRLSAAISSRDGQIDELSSEKQRILTLLRTSGAIESLIELQKSVSDLNARYEVLKSRIDERKSYDRRDDELTATIAHERRLLKSDMEDRRASIDQARALFAEYTKILYGTPGRLSVDVGKEGYTFSFTIDRSGSDGVDQMVVFCFDLTVASIWAQRKAGFPTLIHDSSLFADVDPRQYALALKLAAERSELYGFQYICCLNAGALPDAHFHEFSLEPFIRLRLNDAGPEGRLLGFRLPPREHKTA